MHALAFTTDPWSRAVPSHSIGVNACVDSSQLPNSNGVNSY